MKNGGLISLQRHVALVTGATRNLGKAIAMNLGKSGAKVALNYCHNEAVAQETFAEFLAAGCEGMLVCGDICEADDINRIVTEITAKLGAVDILVPNALSGGLPLNPIEEYDWEFYQRMVDFFIKSPFLLTQAVVSGMKKKKWGRIINIGSEVFQKSVPNFSPYVTAKGAQVGFSRSLSSELMPFGITVNVVAPGWIPSERHEDDAQEFKDAYLENIPAGRWGVPDDVGKAVLYFASEEASFISGQTLCVNGGNSPW